MPSVRRVRWAKFRVTAVLLAGLAILATLVFLLTGGTLFEKKVTLYLYIPDAAGIGPHSPVRVDGIEIGTVTMVELSNSKDPNRIIKVSLAVERRKVAAISVDSITQISTDTLLGDKFVDITSGTEPAPIPPFGELKVRNQPDMMRTIDMADFERQLRIVDTTLSDIEQGRSQLGQFVLTDTVYLSLRKKFIELQAAITVAKRTTSMAGGLIYTDALYRKLLDPFSKLDRELSQLQAGQGELGKFLRDPQQYEQTQSAIRDLRKAIGDAQAADYMTSDTMFTGWNRSLIGLLEQLDQLNASPLFSSSEFFDNLNGSAQEMQKTAHEFRLNPTKFLRLKIF